MRATVILVFLLCANAFAQVPETLHYQGYLADPAGAPIDDSIQVTFSLYAVPSSGAPLWSDVQTILPAQGLFSTSLGNPLNPFPPALFETPLYLGITIDGDFEMTPRIALASSAYSQKAKDAETLGGLPAASLDQSSAVSVLSSDVGLLQARVSVVETDVTSAQADIVNVQDEISVLQLELSSSQSDIGALQTDVTGIESTLPTLQQRVTGTCSSPLAIRTISDTGNVVCTSGPWSVSGTRTFITSGRVGIGTSTTLSTLDIEADAAIDPLRVASDTGMGLMVHANRSVSVGSTIDGPDLGMFVSGDTGIGTSIPAARLSVADFDWQMTLAQANGTNQWHIGASGTTWAAGFNKLVFSPDSGSANAAMVLDRDRNVGIGTVAPETRLHIKGGSDVDLAGGGYLTLGNTTGSNIAIDTNEIMARNNGSTATLALNAKGGRVSFNTDGDKFADAASFLGGVEFEGTSSSILMFPEPVNAGQDSTMTIRPDGFEDGTVGSGSFPFFKMHARTFFAWPGGGYQFYSDRSLKRDVKPIAAPLDIVEKLEGVSYELLAHPLDDSERERTADEVFRDANQLGFIAQDVEKVLPQLVQTEPDTGLKTVGYMGVVPILVEAIKEQQRQIEALRAEVDALRK